MFDLVSGGQAPDWKGRGTERWGRGRETPTRTEGEREVFSGWVSWVDRTGWEIFTLLRFSFQGDRFDKGGSV
ncbi:MAG: hypothetical protein EAZ78_19460 [Oscillatoriales cyanobacterium]|nr:MAG: hypothetical protein EA000_17055 [Oscillatoriales cyanobacterium]TAD95621.1 MAG: hypothetical protein EAZ98_15115 [Oscillatoriales cyanobacterium]TAE01913.1 MAG: hypothetical protein EAZ96_17555 [Oscillatoriales cyanobacterium]TAF00907.1 MAG: hypothetical protein EAZ78_19460 [Oscillatoriales cyanobacterium]TAF44183.1 MAG: hypothetical protein EAZ68_06765 [Oscillatoriales cyanobacterium]